MGVVFQKSEVGVANKVQQNLIYDDANPACRKLLYKTIRASRPDCLQFVAKDGEQKHIKESLTTAISQKCLRLSPVFASPYFS